MADSKRLTFWKRLTEHLASEINGTGLFKFDVSGDGGVVRGTLFDDQNDPVPRLTLLDNIDPDRYPRRAGGDTEHPLQKDQLIVLIAGHCEDDKEFPSDNAMEFLADTKMALAKLVYRGDPTTGAQQHGNYMLGGLITGMTMEPGTVRPPQEQSSSYCFFWMRVVFQFVEDVNNPYALD